MVSFMSRHQKASLFPGFYTLFFLFGGSHFWLSLRIGLEHLNNTSSHALAPKPSEISFRFLNIPRDSHGQPLLRISVFSHRIQSLIKNTHTLHPDKLLICLSLSVLFFFLTSLFIFCFFSSKRIQAPWIRSFVLFISCVFPDFRTVSRTGYHSVTLSSCL